MTHRPKRCVSPAGRCPPRSGRGQTPHARRCHTATRVCAAAGDACHGRRPHGHTLCSLLSLMLLRMAHNHRTDDLALCVMLRQLASVTQRHRQHQGGAPERGFRSRLFCFQMKRAFLLEICPHSASFFLDDINPRKDLTAFLLGCGSVDGCVCLSRECGHRLPVARSHCLVWTITHLHVASRCGIG